MPVAGRADPQWMDRGCRSRPRPPSVVAHNADALLGAPIAQAQLGGGEQAIDHHVAALHAVIDQLGVTTRAGHEQRRHLALRNPAGKLDEHLPSVVKRTGRRPRHTIAFDPVTEIKRRHVHAGRGRRSGGGSRVAALQGDELVLRIGPRHRRDVGGGRGAQLQMVGAPVSVDDEVGGEVGPGGLADEAGDGVQLQPLARIDDPAERAWAAEWLAAILASEGVAVDPQAKEHLWSALGSLASAPVTERTLTGLAVLLQSQQLKQALASYCLGGPWGRLLDAEAERLGEASVQAFETEGLVGAGSAAAVLSYLFHRIEGRLDGSPTLIIIDEGWLVLDSPDFAAQLREWLKTLRKKNASVVFATQSLADIETSSIAPAIIESCPTRIFLPNERGAEPQIAAIYERFGLNARQIEILSRATPKRDYYCQSRRGNRLFELGLGEVALAFAAASSKTDQLRIAELVETHGREHFAAEWLRHRGLAWAVDLLPEPQSDPLAGRREDAGQLPLALKDMTP